MTTLTTRTAETGFREALEVNPADTTTRKIFADWLAENGRAVEANGQRWQARNRQWPRWCKQTLTWDWWDELAQFIPPAGDDGYLEASLPLDVWASLRGARGHGGSYREYGTLRDAETALAEALADLDL